MHRINNINVQSSASVSLDFHRVGDQCSSLRLDFFEFRLTVLATSGGIWALLSDLPVEVYASEVFPGPI